MSSRHNFTLPPLTACKVTRSPTVGKLCPIIGVAQLQGVSTARHMIALSAHVLGIFGLEAGGKTKGQEGKYRHKLGRNAYFVESHDVGLSLRSQNLLSICCVGPERQKTPFRSFRTRVPGSELLIPVRRSPLTTAQRWDDVTLRPSRRVCADLFSVV